MTQNLLAALQPKPIADEPKFQASARQLELRWATPGGRINPRKFRSDLGFALGKLTGGADLAWLFNQPRTDLDKTPMALIRFGTGHDRKGPHASISVVGDESCSRFVSLLPLLFQAIPAIGIKAVPQIEERAASLERRPYAFHYRCNSIVLNRIRGDAAFYDHLHNHVEDLVDPLKDILAYHINEQARLLNLQPVELKPEEVTVHTMGQLGCQPTGDKGKKPRITQALVSLPLMLVGDWRAGTLLTYGNGRINRVISLEERDTRARHPFPRYEDQA